MARWSRAAGNPDQRRGVWYAARPGRTSMKWTSLIAVGILACTAGAARADIPPFHPERQPQPSEPSVQVEITPTKPGEEPNIELPKTPVGKKRSDSGTGSGPEAGPIQTVVAGVFLSLALMGGGLWLVRRRGLSAGAAASVMG